MPAKKKLDDITIARLKKKWAAGEGTHQSLADEFGVSTGTVKRIIKGIPKGSAKEAVVRATRAVVDDAVKTAIASSGSIIEGLEGAVGDDVFARLLRQVAEEALDKGSKLPFNSAGEAIGAGINALKALRSLYPLTMREAARWVVKLPGFQPDKFAQMLMEEWDRAA